MNSQCTFPATTSADASQDVPPQMRDALALVECIGGLELIQKVCYLFRTTSDERMAKIHEALAAGEAAEIARLAHALKGSSAQIGAEPLRQAAVALEQEAVALDPVALAARVECLGREVRAARSQIDRYHTARGEHG